MAGPGRRNNDLIQLHPTCRGIRQLFRQPMANASKTGGDPILVSAAYNAGSVYKTTKNDWCLKESHCAWHPEKNAGLFF